MKKGGPERVTHIALRITLPLYELPSILRLIPNILKMDVHWPLLLDKRMGCEKDL